MADMVGKWAPKLLKQFILLYKDLPCLWDRSSIAYKQKQKRHDAITKLTELVQQHIPKATRVHVLRKIESLRACVRREHKRVINSRLRASHPDEVYKPHLWYYDLCSFVFGEESQGTNEQSADEEEDEEDQLVEVDSEPELPLEQSMENYSPEFNVSTSMVSDNPLQKCYSIFDEDAKSKRHCTEVDDEYDAIGVNVAAKLRGLPADMRILAEKLINDVLFQAQTNRLSSSTIILSPDNPFKQDG